MSLIPPELKYTASHEWVRREPDGTVTIGITDHAQDALGDLVYIEVPAADSHYEAEQPCAVVESVKAASDIYSPVAGQVVVVNEALEEQPEIVNQDPYGQGWILRLKPDDIAAVDALLDAQAYQALLAQA
jgi:glycine cleavage system H protein